MADDPTQTDEPADADAFISNMIDPKYLALPESESVQNRVVPDRPVSDWGRRRDERRQAIADMAEMQDMITGDLVSPRAIGLMYPSWVRPVSHVWSHPLAYPPLPTGLTGQIGAPEARRKNANLQFGDDTENEINRLDLYEAIPDKPILEELPDRPLWREGDPRGEEKYRKALNKANDRYLDALITDSIDERGRVYEGRSAPTQGDVNRLKKEPSPENIRAFEKQFGRGSARAFL
jgi:hypothetical protein